MKTKPYGIILAVSLGLVTYQEFENACGRHIYSNVL